MDEMIIKSIIDRMVYEPISDDEYAIILKSIQKNSDLQKYYNDAILLKENLQSISDEKPFTDQQLFEARSELFKRIDDEGKSFTWIHMIAAILVTVIFTSAFFMIKSSNNNSQKLADLQNADDFSKLVEGNIVSLNVENIDNEKVIFTGKAVNDFLISGNVRDQRIQQMIKNTAKFDPNYNNRIKAVNLLDNSTEAESLLLDVIRNTNDNSIIRLNALTKLSESDPSKDLAAIYINLLRQEQNRSLQMKLVELLKEYKQSNKIYDEIKSLFETSNQESLKRILQKELLEK